MNDLITDNDCPICYDSMTDHNYIVFADCHHRACRSCAEEIMFKWSPKCQLDNDKIKAIINCRMDPDQEDQMVFERQSVRQYRDSILLTEPQSIMEEIENTWKERTLHFKGKLDKTAEVLNTLKDNLTIWNNNIASIENEEFMEFYNIVCEIFEEIHQLHEAEIVNPSDKERFYQTYINRLPDQKNLSFDFMNIVNSRFFEECYDLEFSSFICLSDPEIHQKKYLVKFIENVDQYLNDLNFLFKNLIYFVLSFVKNNKEIYEKLQKNLDKIELNNCLICADQIDFHRYAKLSNCSHKICKSCIDQFMITHVCCPFDGEGEWNDLSMIIDEELPDNGNVMNYLKNNAENISHAMIDEINKMSGKLKNAFTDKAEEYSIFMKEVSSLYDILTSESIKPNRKRKFIKDFRQKYVKLVNDGLMIFAPSVGKFICMEDSFCMKLSKFLDKENPLNSIFDDVFMYVNFFNSINGLQEYLFEVDKLSDLVDILYYELENTLMAYRRITDSDSENVNFKDED